MVVSVPAHVVTSIVNVPVTVRSPIAADMVNTVLASAVVALPCTVQVAASSIIPLGSAGWTVHAVNSPMVGLISASS